VVFAPNPSVGLAYLLLILRALFGYTLVVDAHYAGIVAPRGNALFQWALDHCNRRADLVIVTNEQHRKRVEALGGRALVCEDPLPEIHHYAATAKEESKHVLFICSFDVDEPYSDVFEAAAILREEGYIIWVSGDFRKAGVNPTDWPSVQFMGYAPEPEFYQRLAASQIVVDLTAQDNCLVCGAYEAMVLEKPLVTSRTPALQHYFTAGTVFVDHEPQSIAQGIRLAFERKEELRLRIREWKRWAEEDGARKVESIRAILKLPARLAGHDPEAA
jgi:glycosyltransferase involved in cell wall biosynthesis